MLKRSTNLFTSTATSITSRSISTSVFRMAPQEDTKATEQTVPSEEITKEAKEAEPDAVEQNDKMEKKGMDNLPTIT